MLLELHATTSLEYAHSLSDQLTLLGAAAITFQDAGDEPIYEPDPETSRLWQQTHVTAFFEETISLPDIIQYVEAQQAEGLLKNFFIQPVVEKDWVRVCLEQFKPMSFGKRLWICPSWHKPSVNNAVNVMLDPGLAFGTGTHPTTALCLEWLDQHIQGGETIIDYGCGSGILAIAALKLGAKHATAVDHDPQALLATRQNGDQNQLSASVLEVISAEKMISEPVDIVIANILAEPLIQLAPSLSALVKKTGKLVISGILSSQADRLVKIYQSSFDLIKHQSREGWILLEGTQKALLSIDRTKIN